jgi:hypothetical protein
MPTGAVGDLTPAIAILAAVVVVVALAGLYSSSRRSVVLDDIARSLGGTRAGNVVTFARDGREYRFESHAGTRHRSPWMELRTDSAPGLRWSVVPPKGWLGFGEGIGRGEEITTRDPELDATMRLFSPEPLRAVTFFSMPEHRKALAELFRVNANEMAQDEVEVTARWNGWTADHDAGSVVVPSAVPHLRALAEGTPSTEAKARIDRLVAAQQALTFVVIALALGAGFLAAGLRTAFQVLDWNRFAIDSLALSVPITIGLALLVWRSGLLDTARLRTRGFGFIGGLVLVPYLLLELAIAANGWLDDGPATPHAARVLRTHATAGRSHRYELAVSSWRGHDEELFDVDRAFFERVQRGTPVHVVTKPGRFGYEWVVEYVLADRP